MTLVGLNPSTADAGTDDATTRRVIGFARATGCDQVTITNLYAWRSTTPNVLRHAPDPVGPDNDHWIRRAVDAADLVVAAWGTHADPERATAVLELLRHHTVWCLGTTRDGHPRHPLYVPNRSPLQIYTLPPDTHAVHGNPSTRSRAIGPAWERSSPKGCAHADPDETTPTAGPESNGFAS